MITTTIQIEPYVAEYIRGKYWDARYGAVHFPAGSDIYVTLYDLMERRPKSAGVDRGNLTLCLPERREANKACGKSPEAYNWFSSESVKILERRMKVMMWAELHETLDEAKHLRGIQFVESVYVFMKRYDLQSISEDALLKNYQRWRDKQRRSLKRGYQKGRSRGRKTPT